MKSDEIAERIATAIAEGRVSPGAKLNERDVAAACEVSRTVVRQALSRLQQEGLVQISPKRATTVVKPTIEDAHQLFDAIGLIEGAVVERLVQSNAVEPIAAMRRHVEAERSASTRGDTIEANRLGRGFHELFVSFLGNPVLAKLHAQLIRQQALITALFKTDFDYGHLHLDHWGVVDCLEAGDIQQAKEILRSHYSLVIRGYQFRDGESGELDVSSIFAM